MWRRSLFLCLVKWPYFFEKRFVMTIGEFSVITGISAYTLRYCEKKSLFCVSRDSIGRRDYSEDDTMAERMELLIQHRKSVVGETRK
ncbi:MerR family regulatory protein [uncultured Clostridium sp.]|nr:MerR family regulatory protein [uncultured Clostridium sp.]